MKISKGVSLLPVDLTSSDLSSSERPAHGGTNSELCSVSSTDDGYNVFSIVETVYDEYILLHLLNFDKTRPFQLVEFYGTVFSC